MELADAAMVARLSGANARAQELLRQAFAKEEEAARLVSGKTEMEPTRSVLHRSAASLALECNEVRAAEQLIAVALAGDPPEEIAEELRDLLERVYFQRHLALRGVTLQPDEFQLSLAGASIGLGIAQSDEFIDRVRDLETVIYRTAERKQGRPYREGGRRKGSLQRQVELYVSAPRAASFAVTFRLGSTEQLGLPGMTLAEDIIGEVFECFSLFALADTELLRTRMGEESYYRNFVGLARKIAPDGQEIRMVGLTARQGARERQVVLSTPRNEIQIAVSDRVSVEEAVNVAISPVQIRGFLKLADSRSAEHGTIQLIDSEGRAHPVRVRPGMMSDIVKPLYEEEVIVSGTQQGDAITLDTIDRAS
jgi:hypothetical protein